MALVSMKKQQVFYIHGGSSYDDYGVFLDVLRTRIPRDLPDLPKPNKWTETFRDELGSEYEVFMPQMPNSQNAKYEEWKIWFERHFEYLEGDVILVGLSLGAMFLAKYLSEEDVPFSIKMLFLLAGAVKTEELDETDCGDFLMKAEDASVLAEKIGNIVIMHSKDDLVAPYESAIKLKAAMPAAELVTFEDKNHFLVPEFPELIEKIRGCA
jgi:predicted alpha/beta hydrolase family esterase